MLDREFSVLLDAFRRLIRRNAVPNLKKIIVKTHPADLARVFRNFTPAERDTVFGLIDDHRYKAEFLTELDEHIFIEILSNLEPAVIVTLLNEMALDDQADIVAQLPEELEHAVLDLMDNKESEGLEELLMYPPESAGGIMAPLPLKVREDQTVQDAIKVIREDKKAEMLFYIYVVDEDDKLRGVLSIRHLLTVAPTTMLKDIMIKKVISIQPETDQEEVARITSRYDFLALPVVDNDGILLGIVTVDDIIDVIREEATEDFLQMAGVGKDREILLKSPLQATRIRFPWLFATFFGGLIVSLIVMNHQELINQFILLAAFMPIVAGMGGNVGTQSSTIVVRGLATGRVNVKEIGKLLYGQVIIGLILGVVYGILIGVFALIFYHNQFDKILYFGLTLGVSLTIAMLIAATTGTLIPLILNRFNIDPAVATGPIVTTTSDIIGVFVYLTTATIMLM
ncbi:MAG: magnesium transporter [Candidatus Cloacimonadota bacterium]|nr:magnesium transporter [Candidatus Cloacimonadota bacterium]